MQRFNKINASSLCHFTGRFDVLQKIIRNGIRFSFAFEKLSPTIIANFEYPSNPQFVSHIYENAGVAIPMVSFCDIPITRVTEHISKYGQYMIGLNKKIILDLYNEIINPVFYIYSDNLHQVIDDISNVYAEATNLQMQEAINKGKRINVFTQEDVEEIVKEVIEKFPYTKRKISSQFIVGLSKPCYSKDGAVCYYDEREWRAFWLDRMSVETNWKWGITYENYVSNKSYWNKELESDEANYITIPEGILRYGITHIVVKNDNQIPRMIDFIMNSQTLFGQTNVSKSERLILVSKITSFERVALDY
jgi:hypothetical protein